MSLAEFNTQLLEFGYSYSETKPAIILSQHLKPDATLKETGAGIWSLALITPLILGPLVGYDHKYCLNYLLLLEITTSICVYEMFVNAVAFMQDQIELYLETFRLVYKTYLIPKQHLLIHYPSQILKFEPSYAYNTIRNEAKHQYFKDFLRRIKNLKNPAVSIANQHQLHQIYLAEQFDSERQKTWSLAEVRCDDSPFVNILLSGTESLVTASWFEIDGVIFIPALFDGKSVVICRLFRTIEFAFHYNAYAVEEMEEYKIINPDELFCYSVYHAHRVKNTLYIIVKQSVGDMY